MGRAGTASFTFSQLRPPPLVGLCRWTGVAARRLERKGAAKIDFCYANRGYYVLAEASQLHPAGGPCCREHSAARRHEHRALCMMLSAASAAESPRRRSLLPVGVSRVPSPGVRCAGAEQAEPTAPPSASYLGRRSCLHLLQIALEPYGLRVVRCPSKASIPMCAAARRVVVTTACCNRTSCLSCMSRARC
jgi:hypothetical protein